jgi:hypothetical protein
LGNEPDNPCGRAFYADDDADGHGDPTRWAVACEMPSGYSATADDCDDDDAIVHPGAIEICNDIDDDCDASIDVDAIDAGTWFVDRDADGFGDDTTETRSCVPPAMHSDVAGDCDDASDAIHPGAAETCDDLDDDCDGLVDALDGDLVDGTTWYTDADGDTYGDPGASVVQCVHPEGTVADGTDCDDLHANIRPDVSELCDGIDNDCDGLTDDDDPDPLVGTTVFYADADGDGLGDAKAPIEACEVPAGFVANDEDCDDGAVTTRRRSLWYEDDDGDGYGGEDTVFLCEQWPGWTATSGDCDDRDSDLSPAAAETCNEIDDDCDSLVDDDDPSVSAPLWYADDDRDGYGDDASAVSSCVPVPDYVSAGGDCDLASADVYPSAPEQCDMLDNDCDGSVDESVVYSDWHRDDDGDGYGTSLDDVNDCVRPSGYVAIAGDCDDLVATTWPDAEEICANDTDDDCDGLADNCTLGLEDASAGIEGAGPDWSSNYAVGQAVAAGDLNGDGTADLLVGDLANSTAHIVYGPLSGTVSVADVTTITTTVSGWFGAEVETGDVDGDGASDALVGDYETRAVYAFLGPITGATETADADAVYVGASHNPDDLAMLGDVDVDGVLDLAIGSAWAYCTIDGRSTSHCGAVYVVSGLSTGTVDLPTEATYTFLATAEDALGISTVSMGDTTSDGIEDFALGAELAGTSLEGTVYLVAGGAESGSYDPAAVAFGQITSELDERRELAAILAGTDYDDDGHGDLFVGAPEAGSDDAGAVYLFYGPLSGDTSTTDASVRWEATEPRAALGSSVSVGDVDADGERDVLIGGVGNAFHGMPGGAWLQLGKASGVIDVATLPSFQAGADNEFGWWSGLVPDWNGDLGDEIAVGAPGWEDASGHPVGKIWIFSSEAF